MAAAMIVGYVCVVPSPEHPWTAMECDIGIVYKLAQL